jgi:hypothetical protein
MRIADEYFVIAHDPDSCQPYLNHQALGLGLAAGLLCELLVDGWVVIAEGAVYPSGSQGIPAEPLQHRVWDLIRGEPKALAVDVWLRYLAQDAVDLVGDRLVRARRYQRDQVRVGLLRRTVQLYCPLDPGRAAYATVRLRTALRGQVSMGDVLLTAIAVATELAELAELWDEDKPPEHLRSLFRQLPQPLWEVVTHTQASVAHIVMTR